MPRGHCRRYKNASKMAAANHQLFFGAEMTDRHRVGGATFAEGVLNTSGTLPVGLRSDSPKLICFDTYWELYQQICRDLNHPIKDKTFIKKAYELKSKEAKGIDLLFDYNRSKAFSGWMEVSSVSIFWFHLSLFLPEDGVLPPESEVSKIMLRAMGVIEAMVKGKNCRRNEENAFDISQPSTSTDKREEVSLPSSDEEDFPLPAKYVGQQGEDPDELTEFLSQIHSVLDEEELKSFYRGAGKSLDYLKQISKENKAEIARRRGVEKLEDLDVGPKIVFKEEPLPEVQMTEDPKENLRRMLGSYLKVSMERQWPKNSK